MVVEISTAITGVTVEEFQKLIPTFEADMATYYGTTPDKVMVTEVKDSAGRRRLLDGGIEVDYVVIAEDRSDAEAVAVKVESSEAVVAEKITEAAAVVLNREVVIVVEVEEVFLEAKTAEELQETLDAAAGLDPVVEPEGEGVPVELLVAIGALVVIGGAWMLRKKPVKVYVVDESAKEEEAKAMKEEEEARVRKEEEEARRKKLQEKEEEDRKALVEIEARRVKELEDAEKKRAFKEQLKMKPRYSQLGEASKEGADLENWLASKHVEIDDDNDDDDDDDEDEVLMELLEHGQGHGHARPKGTMPESGKGNNVSTATNELIEQLAEGKEIVLKDDEGE